jgi:hypothetical protein
MVFEGTEETYNLLELGIIQHRDGGCGGIVPPQKVFTSLCGGRLLGQVVSGRQGSCDKKPFVFLPYLNI